LFNTFTPVIVALMLCDKCTVKMSSEVTQLLSSFFYGVKTLASIENISSYINILMG